MSTNPLLNDRRIGPIINPLNVDDPNVKLGKGNVWWSNEIETTTNINQEEIKAMLEKEKWAKNMESPIKNQEI